ncbi:TetR/AcrR family transcriptional regulator [Cytobacillus sp. IB215665]|uniref:TetR/AcrR family transcriptional regulator n=1 Tax=Cytobacillus sp. IB215665 TaxID=3097357 RepID=UPI002A0E71CA|nr:TetR/AcrR family transcriptional regulator [Cytobacillus sp. IB215665]MDX8367672.1 TetR/AcrR family transcriptional regulator [Cytobacillus sp. IB215665]
MSEKTVDKRVIRTKKMLRDALTELMEEKGLEGISVNELTKKADINRGTFYIHYHDKYDFLEQCENELFEGISETIKGTEFADPINPLSYINREEPLPHVLKLAEFFARHARFLKILLGPNGNPTFQRKFKDVIKRHMFNSLENQLRTRELIISHDYFFAYVSSANLGVIQMWLENDIDKTPKELAMILTKVTLLGPGFIVGLTAFPK